MYAPLKLSIKCATNKSADLTRVLHRERLCALFFKVSAKQRNSAADTSCADDLAHSNQSLYFQFKVARLCSLRLLVRSRLHPLRSHCGLLRPSASGGIETKNSFSPKESCSSDTTQSGGTDPSCCDAYSRRAAHHQTVHAALHVLPLQ